MKFFKISFIIASIFTTVSCHADTPLMGAVSAPNTSGGSTTHNQTTIPTAQQWNKDVVGWNLGNNFECSAPGQDGETLEISNPTGAINAETAWGNARVTRKVITAVKKAGFNAVRIPIRWQCHITNAQAMSIDKAWMARIKEVVGWCLDNDLKVIINVHHEKWLESRPTYKYKEENCQKLALLWMNIASEFAQYDYRLAFAGTNEVHSLRPKTWRCKTPITKLLLMWCEPRAATTCSVTSLFRPMSATPRLDLTTEASSYPPMSMAMATNI